MENLKASDFRIGNLVTDSSGFICEIKEIRSGTVKVKYHSDKERYCMKSFCEIFSIPITEEWLIKFGFIFGMELQDFVRGKYSFVEIKDKNFSGYFCENFIFYYGIKTNIKHVHQLQNIYYALIGEELQCNQGA